MVHMIDAAELEGCADAVCSLAGVDECDQVYPSTIARKLLGPRSVVSVQGMRAIASLSSVDGRKVIAVRRSLSAAQKEHAIGHELGHWILSREGYAGDDVEAACDFIGAALVARRRVFRDAARNRTIRQLAFDFGSTETLAALRLGEVTGSPIAVVSPAAVRVRGDAWEWPSEQVIRRGVPGLRKCRFTDDGRRFAIMCDANG